MSPAYGIIALFVIGIVPYRANAQAVLARGNLRTELVGCWTLLDSTRKSAEGSLYWAPAIAMLNARLDSSRWARPKWYAATRLDERGVDLNIREDPRGRGLNAWSADSLGDSIRVQYSSGFSGTSFSFAVPFGTTPDTLHGVAVEHWDYKPSTPRGAATAIRRRCP